MGETRWAFFVRVAHHGAVLADATELAAIPSLLAGMFDESVWAWETSPTEASAKVGFEWEEREPFSVKVWLPHRFGELDAAGTPAVRERVRLLLDRHRAAGVHVYVTTEETVLGTDGIPHPI